MTTGEISDRIIRDLDEDPLDPTTGLIPEVLAAINEGQQLAAILTLSIERTAGFSLSAATPFFTPRTQLADLIVPLRVTIAGVRIRPATLRGLDALDDRWQAIAGNPARYAVLGCNLLAVTPQPSVDVTANVTYASTPALLVLHADIPELPEAYHQDLVEYGYYRVRLKEGAQGLKRGLDRFKVFLDDMTQLGNFVRARSMARGLDVLPPELQQFDRSRLMSTEIRSKPRPLRFEPGDKSR